MGEVYLGEHLSLQKSVAVKILPPAAVDHVRIDRFFKEARLGARIEHPNVITVHDVGQQDGLYYILMQYVQGQNLAELVKAQGGPVPWRQALKVMRAAAKGTAAIHRHGLIHRDIKPSNIMVASDGRVLVMDFGLAREESQSDLTPSGAIMGTPAFMSPEQCRGRPLDRRSDIFSLGGTLYFLLTARLPFEGGALSVWTKISSGERPPPVHTVNPFVPRDVSDLVARALAHPPRDRFADAETLAQEIGKLSRVPEAPPASSLETGSISGGLVETKPPAAALAPLELIPEETLWERLRVHRPWVYGGAVAVVGVLVFLATFFVDRPESAPRSAQAPSADREGMVWIPEGFVQMGNTEEKLRSHALSLESIRGNRDELEVFLTSALREPRRRASVRGFWIDRYEVTQAEYAKFVVATNHNPPEGWRRKSPPPGMEEMPVVGIRQADALAYAAWSKKKLPTDEQWVRAFRGDLDWLFPWGDTWEPARANVKENKEFGDLSPITATPRDVSPFGVYNLVGNAGEMMRDVRRVLGQEAVVSRGASWLRLGGGVGVAPFVCYFGNEMEVNLGTGFRCVDEEP
jgi:formylglycine-generating enzyme required for sulfatase activity